jgi:porin
MKGEQIQSALLVYDTQNSSTTIAPDLFARGSVVIGYHRFFTKFGGKDGSQGFLANYSNATYASTDPLSYTVIPGESIAAGRETGSWSLGYFADQLLYVDRCNPNRNLRFFSQWGLADKKTSPYAWVGTVALQGSGLNRCRPADTMGVGYFYNGLSSDFKDLVSAGPRRDIQDVQGVELYYNATVRPWFHLTTDLQVIDNEQVADNTALVLGMRASIDL